MMYNHARYIELWKCQEDFENQEKLFYDKKEKEYLELIKYEAAIASHVHWKNKTLFFLLMEKFVDRITSGEEFSSSFFELRQRMIDECDNLIVEIVSEKLKYFEPDPRSKEFGDFVGSLWATCDHFTEDWENEDFYNSVKDCFLGLMSNC